MLQSLALWLLKDYVGEYIENLNADQLSIGYGGVELDDLHLKKTIFNKLNLPLNLVSGVIGKLKLVIPYVNPNSLPWVIKIEKLSLVVELSSDENRGESEEQKAADKKKKLQQLDAQLRASLQRGAESGSWWGGGWIPSTFYSSFSTKIVENLQFDITDVHIQYKDAAGVVGLNIASLSVQSTNNRWKKGVVEFSSKMKYKLVELNDLSVYFDEDNLGVKKQSIDYILAPISATAKIRRNSSKESLSLKDGPRFHIELILDELNFRLADNRYRPIVSLYEELSRYFKRSGKKERPKQSITGNAVKWWKFAIRSILQPICKRNEKKTKSFILDRVKDLNKYSDLYNKSLTNTKPLSPTDQNSIELIEKRWSIEEITALRRVICSRIDIKRNKVDEVSWSDWAMSFNPYWSTASEVTITQEEKEFFEQLEETYKEEENVLDKDSVFAELVFTLKSGKVVLNNHLEKKDIIAVELTGLKFSSEVRPKHRSWEWSASLGSLLVQNNDDHNKTFPGLIWPKDLDVYKTAEELENSSFLSIKFCQKELPTSNVYRVCVVVEPSNIVYTSTLLSDVKNFFTIAEKSRYKLDTVNVGYRFRKALNSRIEDLKNATRAELVNVVGKFTKGFSQPGDDWNIELDIAAPQLIIPMNDKSNKMVLVNLGRIVFCNEHAHRMKKESVSLFEEEDDEFLTPSSTPPSVEELTTEFVHSLTKEEITNNFYNSYTLELSMLQVVVCDITDSWQHSKGFGPNHVLDEFSVCLLLNRRTVFSADPDIPALTLSGIIPQLLVHVDEKKLQVLTRCMNKLSSNNNTSLQATAESSASVNRINSPIAHSEENSSEELYFETENLIVESKLVLAKLSFEKLSLGLHSRGRCVAELQVGGIECEMTKRPFDISASFIVSSCLLIDAMQPFGKDYELLISSKYLQPDALTEEVLIRIDYQQINGNCALLGNTEATPLKIANLSVGSLHINGNLETIVELGNVINQLVPKQAKPEKKQNVNMQTFEEIDELVKGKLQLTADFRELKILLFRTIVEADGLKRPQRITELTMQDVEVSSSLETKTTTGSMRRLLVRDLMTDLPYKLVFNIGEGKHSTDQICAITFDYHENAQVHNLQLNIASAYYTHNPQFIKELVLCFGDYKAYALNLASSLQSAATDMARTIVVRRSRHDSFVYDDHSQETLCDQQPETTFLFDIDVATPVVILPKDDTGVKLLVAYLGKIAGSNRNTEEYTNAQLEHFVFYITKVNFSSLTLEDEVLEKLASDNIRMRTILKEHAQTQIVYNTDLYLRIDRVVSTCQPQHIEVEVKVNSSLKMFLSMPIYQQALDTLQFATNLSQHQQPLSPVSSTFSFVTAPTEIPTIQTDESTEADVLDITASLRIPHFVIELHGELDGTPHGFVNIEFELFEFLFKKLYPDNPMVKVNLYRFSIEDLLHSKQDRFKYLVSSHQDCKSMKRPESSSLPTEYELLDRRSISQSLPSLLRGFSPEEVHTSPLRTMREGLVAVEIIFLPEENGKKRKTMNVDIESLECVINLQTWVILLEFFGIGAQQPTTPQSPANLSQADLLLDLQETSIEQSSSETSIELSFRSLAVCLNKEDYALAQASISDMHLDMTLVDGDQDINASIGAVTLEDTSPLCGYYRQRLITKGKKAIAFKFYRYGKPDPGLTRPYDMNLDLELSAIQYVHTQRFLIETIAFCQHFILLQEVLARIRAVKMGSQVFAVFNRAARLKLKLRAESPTLVLPRKTTSTDLLAAHLATLNIHNNFVYATDTSTIAHTFIATRSRAAGSPDQRNEDRLLDSICIKLSNIKVYSGTITQQGGIEKQGSDMMLEPCSLQLNLERNLEWMFGRQVADMSISGELSSVLINLDLSQYSLIMGMLAENLGEPLAVFKAPSSFLVDPLKIDSPSAQLWTIMHVKLQLCNVSLELCPRFSFGNIPTPKNTPISLAKFDFIDSALLYESFSDGSKAIDLVSSNVLISDTRKEAPCRVLLPSRMDGRNLQFEIHYLDTKEKSLVTFLCNQSRILLMFDFLYETFAFLSRKEEKKHMDAAPSQTTNITFDTAFEQISAPSGVVTKGVVAMETPTASKPFELKVNITESELVVVEDVQDLHTRTVFLKTTAVFAYRPNHDSEKLVSSSFQSLEVFSCILSAPEESALSIVDPVAFLVELKAAPCFQRSSSVGLLNAVPRKPVLEVQFQVPVYIRVSYYDIQMFLQISISAQKQLNLALNNAPTQNKHIYKNAQAVARLVELGFSEGDCARSLQLCGDDISRAALWLTANAKHSQPPPPNQKPISGFEVKGNLLSIILIDDCGVNDVPLLDICIKDVIMQHEFDPEQQGLSRCVIDANYYNTRVSAWEPFIETWKFNTHWSKTCDKQELLSIKVDAPERLDMNLTCAFMDIARHTSRMWSQKFYDDFKEKKRAPFLPFTLRNKTGYKLSFYTLKRSPSKITMRYKRTPDQTNTEKHYEVENDREVAFTFEQQSKLRHQTSQSLTVHQIVVQIAGLAQLVPVTVDRVGSFYREASPLPDNKMCCMLNNIFIIFDICLESSRKVITVKSALTVSNDLLFPVELMARVYDRQFNLTTIPAGDHYNIPLQMLSGELFVRPTTSMEYVFCTHPLDWRRVKGTEVKGALHVSQAVYHPERPMRIFSLIRCMGLPSLYEQPQHEITLVHQVLLQNNLPFDLFFMIKGSPMKTIVKPGELVPLQTQEDSDLTIGFSFESFPQYDMITIPMDGVNYVAPLRLYDTNHRLLMLNAYVVFRRQSIKICVVSPYWLINKTGIPLVFKREDETEEVAGQFGEHEQARSLTPLMFSYFSSDFSYHCQMRIGRNYQASLQMTPVWCKPFSLERDSEHRTLYARCRHDKPERTFDIGINIAWGEDIFNKTRIVQFVPRYQFINKTNWVITVAQKYLTVANATTNFLSETIQCYPGAVSIFHWPRSDLDQIVCFRINNEEQCHWSGGIKLKCETSYHLNLTFPKQRHNVSMRVNILLKAGTYRCTISDGAKFPPPYRIHNNSDVVVTYWQSHVMDIDLHSYIKPKESKAYILHDPLEPASIKLSVYGETSEVYNLRQSDKNLNKLYYQNAIFIAYSHTFSSGCSMHKIGNNFSNLVLDVLDGKNVIVSRKMEHKRTQLWRMSPNGKLIHFTSSAPKEGRRVASTQNCLVLDVEEIQGEMRLVLNQSCDARSATQTWSFQSNQLVCQMPGLCVEMSDRGVMLSKQADVMSKQADVMRSCIVRQKLRPGSGVLTVSIYTDGPTQVVEISDAQENAWQMVPRPSLDPRRSSTEIVMSLVGGFGISLINFHPEELLFISLSQITVLYHFNSLAKSLNFKIGSLQVDNQLLCSQLPVAVFAIPSKEHTTDIELAYLAENVLQYDVTVVKELSVNICKLKFYLEDRLLLKLVQVIQMLSHSTTTIHPKIDHHNSAPEQESQQSIFFERILINQGDLSTSLYVTGKLEKDLIDIKRGIGIPLVSFEDAVISFDSYVRQDVFESSLLTSIATFYKDTFKSQAAVLLGSLDILGNPMGLIQDFSSGVEGLIKKGNIGGLFVNVAHGFSDSAAKMTGVIADSLWSASMDNKFQESRDSLRVARASSSSTHFSAGLKGLGMGVIGGLTSMVTQPIEGASKKGVTGFFSGLGKGLVGTVAKPIAGVLDLASGTAAAVRMTTKTTLPSPPAKRLKRNCYGPGGVLGKWSRIAAEGQDVLLKFNGGNTSEMYVSMEPVRPSTDKFKALLTNKALYFVKSGPACPENIVLHVEYSCFRGSNHYYEGGQHYIEMYLIREKVGLRDPSHEDRTVIRCEGERLAQKISQKMNYLKSLHNESISTIKQVT